MPSGNLWAKSNLGVTESYGAGFYFSWGNVIGHEATEEYNFNAASYNETPGHNITSDIVQGGENDAAAVIIGDGAKTPSKDDFNEILNEENCTHEWVENYLNSGVDGILFTSVRNNNKIFLPVIGYINGTSFIRNISYYWTTNLDTNVNYADALSIQSSGPTIAAALSRFVGRSIRAIK